MQQSLHGDSAYSTGTGTVRGDLALLPLLHRYYTTVLPTVPTLILEVVVSLCLSVRVCMFVCESAFTVPVCVYVCYVLYYYYHALSMIGCCTLSALRRVHLLTCIRFKSDCHSLMFFIFLNSVFFLLLRLNYFCLLREPTDLTTTFARNKQGNSRRMETTGRESRAFISPVRRQQKGGNHPPNQESVSDAVASNKDMFKNGGKHQTQRRIETVHQHAQIRLRTSLWIPLLMLLIITSPHSCSGVCGTHNLNIPVRANTAVFSPLSRAELKSAVDAHLEESPTGDCDASR